MSSHFTVDGIKASLKERGVYCPLAEKWDKFASVLDVPRDEVRHALSLSNEGKLDRILGYVVKKHPYGSWRLLIWALDSMSDCVHLAGMIRTLAEPAEQSLTCEQVHSVLKQSGFSALSKDWLDSDGLADTLLVPIPQKERISKEAKQPGSSSVQELVLTYWCDTLFNASWATLAAALYYLKEKKQVIEAIRTHMPSNPQYRDNLDTKCLLRLAAGVDKYCEKLRKLLNIPPKLKYMYVPDAEMERKKESIFNNFVDSHPSPSWRLFASALYHLGEHEALETVYKQYLPSPDKLRRHDAYQRAMDAEGYHDQIVMQGIMAGMPRSGKSSLMAKLTHKEVSTNPPSTGVAEKVVPVNLSIESKEETPAAPAGPESSAEMQAKIRHNTVNIVEGLQWKTTSRLQKEHATIIERIYRSLHLSNAREKGNVSGFQPPLQSPTKVMEKIEFPQPAEATDVKVKPKPSKYSFLKFFRKKKVSQSAPPSGLISTSSTSESLSESFSSFSKDTVNENPDIEVLWTLYLSDAGGQPEFQELLAAVVSGPSLFFVVFPLHLDLNKHYTVDYLDDESNRMLYPSSLPLREELLQLLASIASTGIITSDGRRIQPKVLFIGTHKDKLPKDQLQQIILEKDQILQDMVRATEAIDEKMVVFASKSQMIFTVDNTQPDDHSDFELIRSTIHRIGHSRESIYKVRVPYTWMLLSVAIRFVVEKYARPVIPYEECFELAQSLGIKSRDDFNQALFFLHTQLGIIRYYQDVPSLCGSIICDSQHIYNRVTAVIKATFTYENCPDNISVIEQFQKKGIFERSDLVKLLATEFEDITPDQLLDLLEHLDIIAPFDDGEKKAKGKSHKRFFLPCALQHVRKLSSNHPTAETCYSSLLFTFKQRGYCPKGIFGALVVDILKRGPALHNNPWILVKDTIYRNQFSMLVGPYSDTFTFQLLPHYIKVDVYRSKNPSCTSESLNEVCYHVRSCIESSLANVATTLSYNDGARHSVAFLCPRDDETTPHPVQPTYGANGRVCGLVCTRHSDVQDLPVPADHHVWFPPVAMLPLLQKLLEDVADRWEELAIQLDLRPSYCSNLRYKYEKHHDSPFVQLHEMISRWYSNYGPSTEPLIQALENMDENVLAAKIVAIQK